jgi:hypothetical protein
VGRVSSQEEASYDDASGTRAGPVEVVVDPAEKHLPRLYGMEFGDEKDGAPMEECW